MGVGAFAEVWKALETTANRPVALKIFYDRVMVNPEQARIFRLEAQKQAQLEHERVTPIYYCHLDPQHGGPPYYIAMKLMTGGTLEDVLQEQKRIPPQEALTIIQDVLAGLDAAHATGIIHRDIKPRNVLFDKHGRASLADFGIAKDLKAASQTVAGTVMGTPTYMSPEQSLGLTITQASDIYSVGIMLYEMLAGQPPYTGKNVMEILMAHQRGNPPKLSEVVPGISPELERIVHTCLEQDVGRRYSDCKSLMHEIDAIREPAAAGASGSGIKSPHSLTARLQAPAPTSAVPLGTSTDAPAGGPSESKTGIIIAIVIVALGLLATVAWWLVSRR
jgi:serine/threonine-protein kinase